MTQNELWDTLLGELKFKSKESKIELINAIIGTNKDKERFVKTLFQRTLVNLIFRLID